MTSAEMEPNGGILREFDEDSWAECPHCGARFRMWDSWFGSTLWVRDGSDFEPVPAFRCCPNCGRELEGSGSDA